MSGSDREAHPDVREWSGGLPNVRELFGVPHECLEVVERPSRMSGSGWESLPDGWEWSKDYPECPGVFKRPSRISGSGQETLPDVR